MSELFDVLIIIILFAAFGYSHTLLASSKLKIRMTEKIGDSIAFYRLFYNVSSVIIFLAVYQIAPRPDVTVYDLHYPFDIITFALQILSLFGLIWATRGIDLKEFIGISQIERYLKGEYDTGELDEIQTLRFDGAFKYSRHPIYLFSILFLGLRPTMSLFYLTMFICITVYFFVGSYYEEKKLVERFGKTYSDYQKSVPRILPFKIFGKQ